jgi:hypothetical protein
VSEAASFERLDYGLRANKNIERKLVFDVLSSAARMIGFANHRYIGFGSMWFTDFRIAHRELGIDDMISMEYDEHAPRSDFKKPFSSVTVLPAEDWARPYIAWFDFDGTLDVNVVTMINAFIRNCAADSALLMTVNARRNSYASEKGRKFDRRSDTSIGVVETLLAPNVVPPRFEPEITDGGKVMDVTNEMFPEALAAGILAYVAHQLRHGTRGPEKAPVKFVPLINVLHRDGADMITVGGALASDEHEPAWRRSIARNPAIDLDAHDFPSFQRLDLIPITLKEKMALDLCLPQQEPAFLAAVSAAGVHVDSEEVAKYRKYYRHFPVFVESAL